MGEWRVVSGGEWGVSGEWRLVSSANNMNRTKLILLLVLAVAGLSCCGRKTVSAPIYLHFRRGIWAILGRLHQRQTVYIIAA